jgi:hypothetical protein
MLTINTIVKEINNVPIDKLDELYQLICSFTPKKKRKKSNYKEIMAFAGAFSDMSEKDYSEYTQHIKEQRANLFNRN